MCGICGIIPFDRKPIEEKRLRAMMARMKYRGPDDEGVYLDQKVGLGFVRLSILDLTSAGHQPMTDDTEQFILVFNGEIYNYIELREELKAFGIQFKTNTDTEVLLKAYIQYGEACLDKLNGMFAFVIYDKVSGNIFGARDRFGVKPFYYYQDASNFIFASEIPPILEVYSKKNEANEQQIFDYLTFNRTDHTEDTFFKNIKKLQHGNSFTVKLGVFEKKKWYDLKLRVTEQKANPTKFKELLVNAVELRMRSDVPVGVCLSGGLDSSSITSIIAKELKIPEINTFSAIYNLGDKGNESEFINLYKEIVPNMNSIMPTAQGLYADMNTFVSVHAEPIPSTSPFAEYMVMKLAKEKVTVILGGQGADEQLGGYHYFFGFYFKDLLKSLKLFTLIKECIAYYRVHRSLFGFATFLYFMLPKKFRTSLRVSKGGFLTKEFTNKFSEKNNASVVNELYASNSMQEALINHFEYKMEHNLKWTDRNSMSHSLESRTPFLDYRLVEYCVSIDSSAIIRNGYTKSIMREAMKGILPEKIRLRVDKIGFETPEDAWFRYDFFQQFIIEILNSTSFRNRNIINPDLALELYQKHLNKDLDISKDIWKWIHLELWFREFID